MVHLRDPIRPKSPPRLRYRCIERLPALPIRGLHHVLGHLARRRGRAVLVLQRARLDRRRHADGAPREVPAGTAAPRRVHGMGIGFYKFGYV